MAYMARDIMLAGVHGLIGGGENGLASPEGLRVVRTESGLTAAVLRRTALSINVGTLASTETLGLVIASVIGGFSLVFETHETQWNVGQSGQRSLIGGCDSICRQLILQDERVVQYATTNLDNGFTFSDEEFLSAAGSRLAEYVDLIGLPYLDEDVLNPANTSAVVGAQLVLADHQLVSQAAQEAFGIASPFAFAGRK
jgi:hypothetical protein